MGWRNLVGLSLVAVVAGCMEGKKPVPLKRVRAAAPPPVEMKAQPGLPEQPPDKLEKGKTD